MVQIIIFSWLFGSHDNVAHLLLHCTHDLCLSKHKKNITICHLKINIFTAVTYRNILNGRVIVMHVETAGSLFDMRRSRKFSRGGGVTFRPVWVQLHTSGVVINLSKMGRSWHRFLLLVHSEARTRFDDIDKP